MDVQERACKLYQVDAVADCPIAAKIAKMAADDAVEKTFAILGVDVTVPKDLEKFRKSLRFSDSLMETAEKGKLAFVISVIGMIAAVIFTTFFPKGGG